MLNSESTIDQPAYEYIPEEAVAQSLESQARKLAELGSNKHQTMRYHNRNTTEEEKEEFEGEIPPYPYMRMRTRATHPWGERGLFEVHRHVAEKPE